MRSLSNVYKNRFFVTDSEKVPIPDVAFEDKKTALSPRGEDDPEFPQEPSGETAESEAPETDAPEETTAEENVPSEPAEPQLWVPEHIESEQPPAVTKETIGEFYAGELRELAAEVAQQAYYDALNKKKAELRDCIAGVQSLMDELVRAQQQFIEDYTRELKYMATDIAEKMIFEHIAEDDLTLERLVMQTVSSVKNADWLNVEISERLVTLVDKINAELGKPEYNGRARVFPVAGTDGVCRVVTNEGTVVSSIEVQADNLRRAFRQLDQQDAERSEQY